MKRNVVLFTVVIMAGAISAQTDTVENRFSFELSGGMSIATNGLNGSSLNPGLSFEGLLTYVFLPNYAIYAGWGWDRLGSDNSFAGADVCFEETGYVFGLQFEQAIGNSGMNYFLRAGALYGHIETENRDGDIINDTGHGLGWQLAGGVSLPIGNNWSIAPGFKFNSLSRESGFDGKAENLNLNFISLRVGFAKRF